MEALMIAVGLYLTYVLVDRFGVAIDGGVDLANGKVVMTKQEQDYKNAKKRSKIYNKTLDDDFEIISNKDLNNLLAGKIKEEKKA